MQVALRVVPRYTLSKRLRFVVSRELPIEVVSVPVARDRSRARRVGRRALRRRLVQQGSDIRSAGTPGLGPTIVDLDDLEDQKILAQLYATGGSGFRRSHEPDGSPAPRPRPG